MTEEGVAESADIVWRQIKAEYKNILAAATVPDPESSIEDAPMAIPLMPCVLTDQAVVSALKFGVRPPALPSRRPETDSPEPEQFSLF